MAKLAAEHSPTSLAAFRLLGTRVRTQNNQNCTYSIAGPTGSQVVLVFSVFNLANGNSGCTKDRVEIRDGCENDAPVIAKLCGSDLPPALTSSSNCMNVTFVSDASGTGLGFLGVYTIIP